MSIDKTQLENAMKKQKITQEELARLLGTTRQNVSRKMKAYIDGEEISKKFCDAFDNILSKYELSKDCDSVNAARVQFEQKVRKYERMAEDVESELETLCGDKYDEIKPSIDQVILYDRNRVDKFISICPEENRNKIRILVNKLSLYKMEVGRGRRQIEDLHETEDYCVLWDSTPTIPGRARHYKEEEYETYCLVNDNKALVYLNYYQIYPDCGHYLDHELILNLMVLTDKEIMPVYSCEMKMADDIFEGYVAEVNLYPGYKYFYYIDVKHFYENDQQDDVKENIEKESTEEKIGFFKDGRTYVGCVDGIRLLWETELYPLK